MSEDDVSKLFPYAATLLGALEARAVIVVAFGSARGMNGCAPAIAFGMNPEDAAENTRMVRALQTIMRNVADRLGDDLVSAGVPFEAAS